MNLSALLKGMSIYCLNVRSWQSVENSSSVSAPQCNKTDQSCLQLAALFHCLHTQRQQHRSAEESGCSAKAANI